MNYLSSATTVTAIILLITIAFFSAHHITLASTQNLVSDIQNGSANKSNNSSTNSSSIGPQGLTLDNKKVKVVASFYPIFEFLKKIGGDRVEASSLIPVGVEPHDFEPTVQQIQNAETADMLVYNGAGFEGPWIKDINAKYTLDASEGLNLTDSKGKQVRDEHAGETTLNPHVWLDPILAKQQVVKIRDALIKVDSENSAYYIENAKKFTSELDSLDGFIRSALSNCQKKDFIAFHDAFSYFADRYGLTQHSIHGASPEGEILPQRLQEIIQTAQNMGIDTIYSEELLDPRLANTIAQEIPNGKVLVLSPLEGIEAGEQKIGIGYIDKMTQNMKNLKVGLRCQ